MKPDQQRSDLAQRIALLMNGMSGLAFAQKCGFSDSLLRKYLAGSIPGADKLVAIARAGGVSVDWLATGEGPMRPEGREPAAPPLDEALLELAVRLLEEWLAERRLVLRPEPKAKAIAALYEIGLEAQAEGRGLEQRQVDRILRLVA